MKINISLRLLLISIIVLAVPVLGPVGAAADTPKGAWQFKSLQEKLIQDGFQPDNIRKFYQNSRVSFERQTCLTLFRA